MRAALVVLLSVCEHPAARQWLAIMPEAAELSQNLQQLASCSTLLSESGHTLAAIISGQFSMQQPQNRAAQHVDTGVWSCHRQEASAVQACEVPQLSPESSANVECFPISPTPDPTTLVNIVSHLRHRHQRHPATAQESTVAPYPWVGACEAEHQQPFPHRPAASRSVHDEYVIYGLADSGGDRYPRNSADSPSPCPTRTQYNTAMPPQTNAAAQVRHRLCDLLVLIVFYYMCFYSYRHVL